MNINSENNVTTLPSTPPESLTINRKLAARWGGNELLFSFGWLGVPDSFLQRYTNLRPYGLTAGEAMFVIQLMTFKWNDKAPFPSYKTLSKRMGVTDKMVRRYAAGLEGKGYLKRQGRIGTTNSFDLTPLFEALRLSIEPQPKAA